MITDQGLSGVVQRIDIDFDEWIEAYSIISFCDLSEDRSMGYLRLATRDGYRYWYATDSIVLARLRGVPDTAEIDSLISPRLVIASQHVRLLSPETALFLCEREDGSRYHVLRGDAGEAVAPCIEDRFPDADGIFDSHASRATDIEIHGPRLAGSVRTAQIQAIPGDDDSMPNEMRIVLDGNSIWVRSLLQEDTAATIVINGEGSGRSISSIVNPEFLQKVIDRFTDSVEIAFGEGPNDVIRFSSDSVDALLMPCSSGIEKYRNYVQSVIEKVFGSDALNRDSDGDYQLKTTGVPVWARLVDGDPTSVSVFAIVAKDIDCTPELLAEINEINSSIQFARVQWADNILAVSSDLVASTLDPDELFTAFARVNAIGEEAGELILTMFGGEGLNRDAQRWASYLDTDLVAELTPHGRHHLNGSSAIEEWPFEEPVYVLTAADPYNLARSEAANRSANLELAAELARYGTRYCACNGESRSTDHLERGFLTWNLDRLSVLELAAKFRQEAIFEITADEYRLINVRSGDVVAAAPRRSLGETPD